jgi:hypothetical protein
MYKEIIVPKMHHHDIFLMIFSKTFSGKYPVIAYHSRSAQGNIITIITDIGTAGLPVRQREPGKFTFLKIS